MVLDNISGNAPYQDKVATMAAFYAFREHELVGIVVNHLSIVHSHKPPRQGLKQTGQERAESPGFASELLI